MRGAGGPDRAPVGDDYDEGGRRRLEDPDDFVRFKVQAALERAVRVIPVLVDGARPLRPQQLPPELGKLARLNALELSLVRYQYDATDCLTSSSMCWPLPPRMLAPASLTGIPVTWRCGRARKLSAATPAAPPGCSATPNAPPNRSPSSLKRRWR